MIADLRELTRDDGGSALVEFALVISLVSIVSYGVLMAIGTSLEGFFAASSTGLAAVAQTPR